MKKNELISKEVAQIIAKFSTLKGAQFVGINNYTSKSTGEISNYVINANFSYSNAVNKDINTLKSANESNFNDIAKANNFDLNLVKEAYQKVIESLTNNQNDETKSNQSIAQTETYYPVTKAIKMHLENKSLYIYALVIHKEVIQKGEYKTVNSKPLTLAKKAIIKYFDLSTAKYRQFNINPEQLKQVNTGKESFSLS